MAGLDLLGGLGKGLMQGSQFIQQKNTQDAQLRNQETHLQQNQARLDMLNEEHGWNRDQQAVKKLEAERQARVRGIHAKRWREAGPDADPVAVNAGIFSDLAASGDLAPDQIEQLMPAVNRFRESGLIGAIKSRDPVRLKSGIESMYGAGATFSTAPGKDEFGGKTTVFTILGPDGKPSDVLTEAGLGALVGVSDMRDEQERQLKLRELHSRTVENQAQTRAADALTHQRNQAPAPGTGGRSSAASNPTTGFSAKTREQATRAALARKVATGTATPEEADLFSVLQDAAAQEQPYVPPEAKKAGYWRSASTEAVDAEVERQLAALRTQASDDPFAQMQLKDPAVVEELRRDIRLKLGAGAGSGDVPSITTGNRPGQAPQATDQRGAPVAAPNNLDRYFR
ncbi:hypothetical protein [Aromatoleum buckelii]|uniref:DNA pilot protein n=1 Tax=Aromatoleum buckelii TaxID=200254 RepID=A0ABX1N7P1_9RHOO|nr:hypothetical protein [Aromatoleum buckelii]MCK0511947.1 hypothetical protein [Aromatoleum buckelii]